MYQKIRVGAVSYLNTKPLTWGLEKGMLADEMELRFAPPSLLAAALQNGEIDLGLIPVAAIPQIPDAAIISDCCIGADGKVASVALFSEVPLEEIEEIFLDFESRTSVALLKILLAEHWKINPVLLPSYPGYEKEIAGKRAGLVIGDRALIQSNISAYKYDLPYAWKQMTGLPFVFAAWVANKPLPDGFIEKFNQALQYGLSHISDVVSANPFDGYDLYNYYTRDIKYELDIVKRQALNLFLEKLDSIINLV